MSMVTYCRDCFKDVRILIIDRKESNIPNSNKHPKGGYCCEDCYYKNHDPNIKIVEERDRKLNQLLVDKPWWKIW